MRYIPTSYFQVTSFYKKKCVGMHLICYYPYYSYYKQGYVGKVFNLVIC